MAWVALGGGHQHVSCFEKAQVCVLEFVSISRFEFGPRHAVMERPAQPVARGNVLGPAQQACPLRADAPGPQSINKDPFSFGVVVDAGHTHTRE